MRFGASSFHLSFDDSLAIPFKVVDVENQFILGNGELTAPLVLQTKRWLIRLQFSILNDMSISIS